MPATDVYVVPFRGELIECETGLDAVAVKAADEFLVGRGDTSAVELERLAAVLSRYGRAEAAEALVEHARRMRAAEFLANAVARK